MAAKRDLGRRRAYLRDTKRISSVSKPKTTTGVIIVAKSELDKNTNIKVHRSALDKKGILPRHGKNVLCRYRGNKLHRSRKSKMTGGGRGKPDFKD